MWPVVARIGPFTLYSYGLMLALALLAGTWLAARELERRGRPREEMWGLGVWVFVAGLVASRLWWLLAESGDGSLGTWKMLSGGGLVWYGGLLGGGAVGALWIWRRRLPACDVLDSAAPGLALGQAVGRVGCHLAGDGDWGRVTDVAWAVAYPRALAGWPYPEGVRVHPVPLYETGAALMLCLALLAVARRRPPAGTVFAVYLVAASAVRFALEELRLNPEVAAGLTAAQVTAAALAAGGVVWLAVGRRIRRR